MHLIDLTLPSAAENVALDEALLDAAEAGEMAHDVLRLWEPAAAAVVVGRGTRAADEVRLHACDSRGIPVIRRTSGGAAIVTGPGCLMYALVLSHDRQAATRAIGAAHRYVLSRMVDALVPLVPGVAHRGTSDLAVGAWKFSGNSLRVKRRHVLYHGTLVYDFDVALIEQLLPNPPREPDYREGRPHADFVRNLPIEREQLRAAVVAAWQAEETLPTWPAERTKQLVAEKYSWPEWNREGRQMMNDE
ncbi:MAG: lipoate--protein ligase family protein [Planctomycetia bacterium]|nr:lipoate--protein ligase family protein [Planctomycetia bacterium]